MLYTLTWQEHQTEMERNHDVSVLLFPEKIEKTVAV